MKRTSKPSPKKNSDHEIAKARILQLKEQKEIVRFLLPDAPKRKQKRKAASPDRIPCPLTPGTPSTVPAHIPQPWEIKQKMLQFLQDHNKQELGPSGAGDSTEPTPAPSSSSPPHGQENTINMSGMPVCWSTSEDLGPNPDFEFVEFKHESSASTSSGRISAVVDRNSPSIFDEDAFDCAEVMVGGYGSDVDDGVSPTEMLTTRTAMSTAFSEEVLAKADTSQTLQQIDSIDDKALGAIVSSDMLHFDWSHDQDTFKGKREVFLEVDGPTFAVKGLSPLDIFERIWDEDIMQQIVNETNHYAHNLQIDMIDMLSKSRMTKWAELTVAELWTFFGILMLHSLYPLPVQREYWYPLIPYMKIANFGEMMTYNRFILIKKCLHFVNNKNLPLVPGKNAKLRKIQPIVDHLNKKFASLYVPEQEIVIDESLLAWKGRLSFSQKIATKAAEVGIKSYELCESRTGYLWSICIYAGKGEEHDSSEVGDELGGATSQIVQNLVRPLLDKGYTLVMDNLYNSPLLSRWLKSRKTDTIGTLRLHRQYIPESLKTKTKINMRIGEVCASHTEDLTIVVWRDSNVVALISTCHVADVGGKEKYGTFRHKPQVVLDYNRFMGGVDRKDQLIQAYPIERSRNIVWYKKLFRRLLNVSIHNTFVIYSRAHKIGHREFRGKLADAIMKKYRKFVPSPTNPVSSAIKPALTNHLPTRVTKGKPRCKYCYSMDKKSQTRSQYKCIICDIVLCLNVCFAEFHKQLSNVNDDDDATRRKKLICTDRRL